MITELIGKTISDVIFKDDEEIRFVCDDGTTYLMYHEQDCCESVLFEDCDGNLSDLIGQKVLTAIESTNSEDAMGRNMDDSFTWTFYRIGTFDQTFVLRWLGQSNGYYSERVSFRDLKDV